MKSYSQFRSAQDEIALNRWKEYLESLDEETIQKIEEWNALDEDTRQSLIESGQLELDEKWAGLGKVFKNLPGVRTIYGLGSAAYRAAKGDWTGAGLSLGSAIPGPVGWGFVGADIARDLAKGGGPKGAVDRRTSGNKKDPSTGNTQTPGQTTTPGQTASKTTKKQPVTLKFNFPRRDIKTKGSVGNPKTDAWSSKYTGGQDKNKLATNMKGTEKIHQAKDKAYEKQVNKNRSKNYSWRR